MKMMGKYAGDISSHEAWRVLEKNPKAALIDVRTEPEWMFIGLPDLSGLHKRTYCVSWQVYPDMHFNEDFFAEIERKGIARDDPVLLICRSGARSRDAAIALTAHGYRCCYNVCEGFEGRHDEERHRATVEGWKVAGLPWRQP